LARDMLRAFFARDRNVSATASALEIARGTVEHRLKEVEEAIGKPLGHEHMTRLELALRLEGELAGPLRERRTPEAFGVPESPGAVAPQ
jgi:sugar diacid utilization regulator